MAEEKKKTYYIRAMGKAVEVSEELYHAYYKMSRRERFLEEKDIHNGKVLYSDLDEKGVAGEDIIVDSNADSVEDQAIARAMTEQLYSCLSRLTDEEHCMVRALYFDGLSEREYAAQLGMSQRGLNKRRKKVLEKLRRMLE